MIVFHAGAGSAPVFICTVTSRKIRTRMNGAMKFRLLCCAVAIAGLGALINAASAADVGPYANLGRDIAANCANCHGTDGRSRAAVPRVVVVGAGYGGATAAKYIRKCSGGQIEVTVVEREAAFVSCPTSNLVIGGSRQLADITVPFDGLTKRGVRVVRDEALDIDPAARSVKLARGETLGHCRLIR